MAASPVILVVEDQELVRKVVVRTLTEAGYVVLEAPSGSVATEMLAARTPALVITDCHMSGMSGDDLIDFVRARHPGLPMLRISGDRDERAGIATLPKPFTDLQLLHATQSLLEGQA